MRSPLSAADVLLELEDDRLVLIQRRNPPPGWAFPGGFIDVGETAEEAAVREAREETGLEVELLDLFGVYSDPDRDPRQHTLSVVFVARGQGLPTGGDDATEARAFAFEDIPGALAFDHHRILADYLRYRRSGVHPVPVKRCRLALAERSALLTIARSAIRERLFGEKPVLPDPEDALCRPGAAFVTLHVGHSLRGCIGNLGFDRSLHSVVHDMALAAAFDDPRFPPLGADELHDLRLEVSVLSRPEASQPELIVAGWHGVCIASHEHKAVFLPQVAREEDWSRRTLLEQLCLKAGLDPDAWKDPDAELATFTAEIFGEP